MGTLHPLTEIDFKDAGGDGMTHQGGEERRLTKGQRALREGVRALLRRLRVAYTESLEGTSDEAWYQFHIKTPPGSDLQVGIAAVGDAVAVGSPREKSMWAVDDVLKDQENAVGLFVQEGWNAYFGVKASDSNRAIVAREFPGIALTLDGR
jgi:hypothetical protein